VYADGVYDGGLGPESVVFLAVLFVLDFPPGTEIASPTDSEGRGADAAATLPLVRSDMLLEVISPGGLVVTSFERAGYLDSIGCMQTPSVPLGMLAPLEGLSAVDRRADERTGWVTFTPHELLPILREIVHRPRSSLVNVIGLDVRGCDGGNSTPTRFLIPPGVETIRNPILGLGRLPLDSLDLLVR